MDVEFKSRIVIRDRNLEPRRGAAAPTTRRTRHRARRSAEPKSLNRDYFQKIGKCMAIIFMQGLAASSKKLTRFTHLLDVSPRHYYAFPGT